MDLEADPRLPVMYASISVKLVSGTGSGDSCRSKHPIQRIVLGLESDHVKDRFLHTVIFGTAAWLLGRLNTGLDVQPYSALSLFYCKITNNDNCRILLVTLPQWVA